MQSAGNSSVSLYPPQVQLAFPNYSFERDGWFPSDPECPNHTKGVPFSSAFADPNADGQVSCTQCFFHSRIMQSMAMECSHLHACGTCTNCYSPNDGQSSNQSAMSPIMFSANSPYGVGLSSPLVQKSSPRMQQLTTEPYSRTPFLQSCSNVPEDTITKYRRLSVPQEYHKSNLSEHHSYSSPSTPHQIPFISPKRSTETLQTFQNNHEPAILSKLSQPQGLPHALPGNTGFLVTQQSKMKEFETSPIRETLEPPTTRPKHESTQNRKRGSNDVCEVCGDRASGYHYNALTCEGCKGFFRRSINKKEIPYRCKYGGECEMDMYTRRKCPDCRLKKCRAVGMLEECLLTEIQCRSKRRSRKSKKVHNDKDLDESSERSTPSSGKSLASSRTDQSFDPSISCEAKKLTEEVQESDLIQFVGKAFKAYWANPEIVKRWASYLDKSPTKRHPNLCEMATVHVQVLVEFTKKLPGFLTVAAEDQIALLKGSVVEIMLLRNSRGYNLKGGDINMEVIAKDTGLHETNFRTLLDFFARVESLNLDDAEYGLLAAIILFDSDHCDSNDKATIDQHRDKYIAAMKVYSETKEPKRNQIVAKILYLITELRTLYDTHSKMVAKMREKDQLTPLLCEIWDLR